MFDLTSKTAYPFPCEQAKDTLFLIGIIPLYIEEMTDSLEVLKL